MDAAETPMPEEQVPEGASEAAADSEVFLGVVKSFNARRGFGFVACVQTALKFGRDVYISKAEAQLAAPVAEAGGRGQQQRAAPANKTAQPALSEEDLIRFRVRLSLEGYPQAEQIQRVRKYQGRVLAPPHPVGEAGEQREEGPAAGRIASDELMAVLGHKEVALRRCHCGQASLAAGDWVTFCVPTGSGPPAPDAMLEAELVVLVPSGHQPRGVLGSFALAVPRAAVPLYPQWSQHQQQQQGGTGAQMPFAPRADLVLTCHALCDRIVISGLPRDADEAELLGFFGRHGAVGTPVAHAKSGSFASVHFSSACDIPRFIARSVHTFADDQETRLARLSPLSAGQSAKLPGLPPPTLTPSDQPGVLLVSWQAVALAEGYSVDLRPAGGEAPWSSVDASSGKLSGVAAATFERDCQACRIVGLHSDTAFEARVAYTAPCGSVSDVSEPSEWCRAAPRAAVATMGRLQLSTTPAVAPAPAVAPGNFSAAPPAATPPGNFNWPQAWPNAALPQPQPQLMPTPAPVRVCPHGVVLTPPPAPEVVLVDEGFSALVRWPCLAAGAAAFVVELREPGAAQPERFVRAVPPEAVGSMVELRVGGLRPRADPSQSYVAQVRMITACGCESEPSPAAACLPLGAAASAAALAVQAAPNTEDLPTASALEKVLDTPSSAGMGRLPSLLSSRPMATPTGTEHSDKALPPEEDCIILD